MVSGDNVDNEPSTPIELGFSKNVTKVSILFSEVLFKILKYNNCFKETILNILNVTNTD